MRMPGAITAIVMTLAVAGCGGVKVGGHQIVEPVAAPAAPPGVRHVAPDGSEYETIAGSESPSADDAAADPQTERAWARAHRPKGCFVGTRKHHIVPASDAPVDPWLAVEGGKPRVVRHEAAPSVWTANEDEWRATCTAAHDHCLADCEWLVSQRWGDSIRTASPGTRTDEGFDGPSGSVQDESTDYEAFRSVPATRRNLEVGMVVLVSPVSSTWASYDWKLGEVESIDWDAETLTLTDHRINRGEPFPLAGARVAVLRYAPGGQVEVMNGLTPDRVKVRPDEVFLPR